MLKQLRNITRSIRIRKAEDSDSSHLLTISKNKQKRERLDREIIKNANINTQSNS